MYCVRDRDCFELGGSVECISWQFGVMKEFETDLLVH